MRSSSSLPAAIDGAEPRGTPSALARSCGALREDWKNNLYIVTDHRVISLRRIYRVRTAG